MGEEEESRYAINMAGSNSNWRYYTDDPGSSRDSEVVFCASCIWGQEKKSNGIKSLHSKGYREKSVDASMGKLSRKSN